MEAVELESAAGVAADDDGGTAPKLNGDGAPGCAVKENPELPEFAVEDDLDEAFGVLVAGPDANRLTFGGAPRSTLFSPTAGTLRKPDLAASAIDNPAPACLVDCTETSGSFTSGTLRIPLAAASVRELDLPLLEASRVTFLVPNVYSPLEVALSLSTELFPPKLNDGLLLSSLPD